MSPTEKKKMVCKGRPGLSIARQCDLLNLSRSAFYYKPVGIDEDTLAVMTAIDRVFPNTRSSAVVRSGPTCVGKAWPSADTGFDG